MMKVLLAYNNNASSDNPFVRTLKDGLELLNCNLSLGLEEFWTNYMNYDIIHINWPNSLFESWSPTAVEILYLKRILKDIKEKNIKIVYTRHNDMPHYSENDNILECYELIENNADAIVHLGNYGVSELENKLDCKHYVIPHHTYESLYKNNFSKEEARKKLNIPPDKFVILTFGSYRNNEEVNLVLEAYKNLQVKNKYLLAPRLGVWLGLTNWYSKIGRLWIRNKILKLKLRKQNIRAQTEYIPDDDLTSYFNAADIVLIQRKKILNSGNLPMAYYFKKVVIGPNFGNVGEILSNTDNIIFNPDDTDSLTNAILYTYKMDRSSLEEKNHNYAIKNWNIENISRQYFEVYKDILRKD